MVQGQRASVSSPLMMEARTCFSNCTQLVVTEGLRQGDTVSYDTDYGKRKAVNCIVTSCGGGGNHDAGGDDVFTQCGQWTDTGGLRQGNIAFYNTAMRRTQRRVKSTTESTIHNISPRRIVVGGWRWLHVDSEIYWKCTRHHSSIIT